MRLRPGAADPKLRLAMRSLVGQVAVGVLAVVEGVVGTCQSRLEISQDGVDPGEFGQVTWLAVTDDRRQVHASGIGDCCEAAQAVAGNHGASRQMRCGPLPDSVAGEAGYQRELEVHRMTILVERDRGHERDFVLGTSTSCAAAEFAAEVGVVDLHDVAELMCVLALGHRAQSESTVQPTKVRR